MCVCVGGSITDGVPNLMAPLDRPGLLFLYICLDFSIGIPALYVLG